MLPPPESVLPLSPHILSAKSGWGPQGCRLVTRPQQGCRQSLVVCDGDSLHWELPEGGHVSFTLAPTKHRVWQVVDAQSVFLK